MDKTDQTILKILQQDCTTPVQQIADAVNLSVTPCWKRIRKLEEKGIIRQRVALLEPAQVDLGVSVFVHLKTQRHDDAWLKSFAERVTAFDEVMECYRMAGEWDYLLRVVAKDIAAFDRFYKKLISGVEGLSDVSSSFAMEEIKYTTQLPLSS
ncbi:Lrp/AsnC family transcriptional regulator [Oceanospirillum sanctuarii]|uniref:Lrp/AsnC family transcriptional regulator n=1 Tax=Oceanospirillum sanctuarii TaxID=1434821 RepID=UPI000A3807C1|nr:Lrp/AsnC family transcriptional regulator [Oceanospirillum sanctuarii]